MKILIYIVFTLIFLLSSLNLTEEWNVVSILMVYGILFALIGLPFALKKKEVVVRKYTYLVIYLFFISCAVASLINSDISLLLSSIVLFVLLLISFIVLPSTGLNTNKMIYKTVLLGHIPIIFIPLLMNGLDMLPYRGIFYNPNAFGTVTTTVYAIILARFIGVVSNSINGYRSSKYRIQILLGIVSLILILYLINVSGSRTSFLAAVLCSIAAFLYLTIEVIRRRKLKRILIFGSLGVAIFGIPLYLFVKNTMIFQIYFYNIMYKAALRSGEGDILSSRGTIWSRTISEAGPFGKGNDYFEDMGIGAHNTLIGILGQFGWFSLIGFMIVLLICFFYSVRYSLSSTRDEYRYLPIMLFVAFIGMSTGEEMLFKLSMLAAFVSFGSVLGFKKNKREKRVQAVQEKEKKYIIT